MHDYKQLKVWKLAHNVTLDVYRKTGRFPSQETYGLTIQMRKSAASIGSNLAEGASRFAIGDFRRFVEIAAGSAGELDYQLLLARDLEYLSTADHAILETDLAEVRKMLNGLRRYLFKKS